VDATRPQGKRMTEEHLEERSGEGDVALGLAGRWRCQHKSERGGGGDEWCPMTHWE